MKKYDCIIIGAGPGGTQAALKLAGFNKSVCIIEKEENHIGGVCLNEGCIPVKSLLESANIYQKIKNSGKFGFITTLPQVNMDMLKKSAQKNIDKLKNGLMGVLRNNKIDIIFGEASFISPEKIEVSLPDGEKKELFADYFVISTGSKSKEINNLPTDGKYILNSEQLLKSDMEANSILIIGGGYIGCEFASFYNRIDKKVDIIEECSSLLPSEDSDISKTLHREFKKAGIDICISSRVSSLSIVKNGVEASIKELPPKKFDKVLIAVGRIANIEALQIHKANIKEKNGFLCVDKYMRTNIKNIFAVGDVSGSPMFAYTATASADLVADIIAGVQNSGVNYSLLPRVVFSYPPVASIGITQKEAEKKGLNIGIKKKFFKANAKAVINDCETGFAKIIFDLESRRILGASIIGADAYELIHTLIIAIKENYSIDEMRSLIFAHPTLSEIINR